MSVLQVLSPVMTIVLAVACFTCYRTSKPLREKARAEARAKEDQERKAAEAARTKLIRDNQRIEVFSDLEQVIACPSYLTDNRYGAKERGREYRWKNLAEFILKVKGLQDQRQEVQDLEKRIYKQSQLIRELQIQQRDIVKALQLGQPVDF